MHGVAFDVYYDDHNTALQHGHRTWEAFISDSNGDHEDEDEANWVPFTAQF